MKKIILIFLVLFSSIYCENIVSVKLMGLSFHPRGALSSEVMPYKFDKKGYFVPNFGVIISFEHEINEDISLKFSQGIYYDCAFQPAGFSQVNVRGNFYDKGDFRVNGGLGPTLIYRKSWEKLVGYNPTDFYKSHGDIEYSYLWHGGDFELSKKIDENNEFLVSFVPGYPALMSLSLGIAEN